MINKLTKMFTASKEAPVKTPETPTEPATSEAQTEIPAVQNPEEQIDVQPPSTAENISLLKLCDAKLAKLSKFFSGVDEPSSDAEEKPTEERSNETPSAAVVAPAPAQESVTAENISLLQLCDAKLSKWTKFFIGGNEAPAVKQEALTEEYPENSDASATISPIQQEQPSAPDIAPSPNTQESIENTAPDKISEPFLPSAGDLAADKNVENEEFVAEPAVLSYPNSPLENVAETTGLQPSLAAETPKMQQPFPFIEAVLSAASTDITGAIPESNHTQDSAIVEQLQNLERRLEQHIEDAIHAEIERVAFREELRQQLDAAMHSYEQPLLEHKNMIETTMKSAFKKIVDRQAIIENKYNQQIDMIQQVIGTNQESIAETAEKLNKLSEQVRLLNENIQQLTQNIEAYQTKVDIDTVNARLATLENPPKKKRKSWFKK